MSSKVWVQIVCKGYHITDDTRGAELKMLSSNLRVHIPSDNLKRLQHICCRKMFQKINPGKTLFMLYPWAKFQSFENPELKIHAICLQKNENICNFKF